MSILKVWDEEAQKYVSIPAIKGDKGETGEKGEKGVITEEQYQQIIAEA